MIVLSRQARDKHTKGKLKKRCVFPIGTALAPLVASENEVLSYRSSTCECAL
jgi:hypothetical protein|eukprot:COSAG06_NODE_133_length_22471_cov_57.507286_13_plen_52_part_00